MNRRLYRSPHDRVLAGVAGGMAETYDFDPALVRVGWALLILFTGGVFLIVYVVMALVVPLREGAFAMTDERAPGATDTTQHTPPGQPPGSPPPSYQPGAPPMHRQRPSGGRDNGPLVVGAALIIIGGLFLLREFVNIDFSRLWPIAVIVVGLLLILTAFGRRQPST